MHGMNSAAIKTLSFFAGELHVSIDHHFFLRLPYLARLVIRLTNKSASKVRLPTH